MEGQPHDPNSDSPAFFLSRRSSIGPGCGLGRSSEVPAGRASGVDVVPFVFEDGEDVEGDDDGDGLAGHGGVDDAFTVLVALRHDVEGRGFDAHDGKGRGFSSGCRSPEEEPVVGLRHVGGAPRRPPRLESHTPAYVAMVRRKGTSWRSRPIWRVEPAGRRFSARTVSRCWGGEVKSLEVGISCR